VNFNGKISQNIENLIFLVLILLLTNDWSFARVQTFESEYCCSQPVEGETKDSVRTIALRGTRRPLALAVIKELPVVKKAGGLFSYVPWGFDYFAGVTANIAVVEEERGAGTYCLRAQFRADPEELLETYNTSSYVRETSDALFKIWDRGPHLFDEAWNLRSRLASTTGQEKQENLDAYNKTIKALQALEWLEKGYTLALSRKLDEAIKAYGKAIELDPGFKEAYIYRERLYKAINTSGQPMKDYPKAREVEQRYTQPLTAQGETAGQQNGVPPPALHPPTSQFVIVDGTKPAYTLLAGIPEGIPKEDLEGLKEEIAGSKGAVLLTWEEFIRDVDTHITSRILKNEYPGSHLEKELITLLKVMPGVPIGLTWNGGIAFTGNDYEYANASYTEYVDNPAEYERTRERDRRKDPLHPGNHLGPLMDIMQQSGGKR
jgi:tetratricopeptide (TPR) repeat protein